MDSLLSRARDGDSTAEKELFEYLLVRFRAFATHRMREDEAEDVAQEACLVVLRKYKTETFTTGFKAWAYGVMKMEIKSHLRTRQSRAAKLDYGSDYDQAVNGSSSEVDLDLRIRLSDCLRKIVKRNRSYARVLNLIHQGYGCDEICQKLRIRPNNFYVILSRGRQLMRVCLKRGSV